VTTGQRRSAPFTMADLAVHDRPIYAFTITEMRSWTSR
jgi:hypothetical protein